MWKAIVLMFIGVILSTPAIAGDINYYGEREIRTRFSSDVAPPGSSLNPYVQTDRYGHETVYRPRHPVSLDPGNPDYDPGGRYNPLVPED